MTPEQEQEWEEIQARDAWESELRAEDGKE